MSSLKLSILDLVAMRSKEPVGAAIARSVENAQQAESLGYHRYWLAEHHSIAGLACSATAVLIGHIANATRTIRVGSGGVMLPNHAPLIVAEQFGTLEAIVPGPHRSWVRPRSWCRRRHDASAAARSAQHRR